jgi:hypothetical protein
MAASANLQSEVYNLKSALVRLGHLGFDDFQLLDPRALASSFILHTSSFADWSLALNNAPHILLHFRGSANLQSAICSLHSPVALADITAAQSRLVHAFAYDLLRAKAPPLYDALPWHDWDFSIVARRFPLWKTRFLLAGDGTTVTACRCRKSAGVYVLEPDATIARYVECKAAIENVRRFRLLISAASSPNPQSLAPIPLPDYSVDLAIIGSLPYLQPADCQLVIQELVRVSHNVLLIENNPLAPQLDEKLLTDSGFRPASVAVRGRGQRRCWWLMNKLEVRNQKLD